MSLLNETWNRYRMAGLELAQRDLAKQREVSAVNSQLELEQGISSS